MVSQVIENYLQDVRIVKYSNGTRYLTVVEREPNVEEVFIEQTQ